MNYSALSDSTLIELITQANADALSELYDRYNRLIYGLALHIVSEPAVAEEVTLDVFTRVWERAETYRSNRAKVSTWLMGIARYRSIDRLRQMKVRLAPDKISLWATASSNHLLSEDNPEEIVEIRHRQEKVRLAVAQLSPPQKEALALAYFGGYKQREIAEALDIPLGTIKTRIRSAMQKLRQMLREEAI